MSNDFNCDQLEPLLSAYHDGELAEVERAAAEKHLNGCTACQNRLLEIAAVASSLKSLPRLNPKTDVAANIEQLIANQPKPTGRFGRPLVWGSVGIAAAAAVLIFAANFKDVSNLSGAPLSASSNSHQTGTKHEKEHQASLQVATVNEPVKTPVQEPDGSTSSAQSNPVPVVENRNEEKTGVASATTKNEAKKTEPRGKTSGDENSKNLSRFNPHQEVAEKSHELAPVAGGNASGHHLDGSDDHLIASAKIGPGAIAAETNLVAVYDTEQHGVTEELGITTDEDGLYALKL